MPRRHRKWFWIALGVAALVAVCWAALSDRALPYRFLEGASVESDMTLFPKTYPSGIVVTTFVLDKGVDEVVSEARKELKFANGWRWSTHENRYFATNKRLEQYLSLQQTDGGTRVLIQRMANAFDRLRHAIKR
jgi:hypothetical protein